MQIIPLQFTYSKQQIAAAYHFHYSAVLHPKRDVAIALIVLAVGLVFTVWLGFSYLWAGAMVIAVLLLAMLGFVWYLLPAMIYAQSDKLKEEYLLTFTNDGLLFKTKGIDSAIKWSLYTKIRENADFILLYYGRNSFTIIPKAAFANKEDIATLMDLLKQQIEHHFSG